MGGGGSLSRTIREHWNEEHYYADIVTQKCYISFEFRPKCKLTKVEIRSLSAYET